jgi:hypothetical protein
MGPDGFGPPIGTNEHGDWTPFTRFNAKGDHAPFFFNPQGDVVPFEFTNVVNGNMTPFVFDAAGNRIPNINELDIRQSAPPIVCQAPQRREVGTYVTPAVSGNPAFLLLL